MPPTYAGLGRRALAFALDYLLIAAYLGVLVGLGVAVQQFAPGVAGALFGHPLTGELTGLVLITLPVALYFAGLEAAAGQATWGKRRLGLRVQRADGTRLTFARSLGRTALKFVPWELAHACIWQISFAADQSSPWFAAGFALVWLLVGANVLSLLLRPTRQTLYDGLTSTVVVRAR